MHVLISGFLLAIVIVYALALSRWHILWNSIALAPFRSLIQGHLLASHLAILGLALTAAFVSLFAIFRIQESSMVLGSKRQLHIIFSLSVVCIVLLIIKIVPLVIRILALTAK